MIEELKRIALEQLAFRDWAAHPEYMELEIIRGNGKAALLMRVRRTPKGNIMLRPIDYKVFEDAVNAQTAVCISGGFVSYGSPEGGTIQFSYEVLNE